MGSRSTICLEYNEQSSVAVNHDSPQLPEPVKKGNQQKRDQLFTSQDTPVSSQRKEYSTCSFGTCNYQCTLGLSRRANIPDAPLPPQHFLSFYLRVIHRSTLCKGLAFCLWKDKENAQLWCRAEKCTTKRPGYRKVSSAFLFRRITRSGRPHAHLRWGLSYKVNPDMQEPQSRKKNKTKLPSNGDVVRPTDGTYTCDPPGKQVVKDRRVTIHTQREKAASKGPRDHGAYGRSPYIHPHSTSYLP